MPPARSAIPELLAALGDALRSLDVPWFLFGAQAAILHGAARLTADVDVTVDLGTRETHELVSQLASAGFALRVTDVDAFVQRTRVLPVVHSATHIPVDIVLAGPGIEEMFFERAELSDLEGVQVPVACAADIVVMKTLAGRAKDIEDVVAIVAAHLEDLDYARVDQMLSLLEKALDQSDLRPAFANALRRARGGGG